MEKRKEKPTRIGTVVSDKMDKTLIVKVERTFKHPLYKKYIKRDKNFAVHDENNEAKVGDRVKIEEYRPVSKTKRWRLIGILEKGEKI
jgi:small subunit ribosomal protein S17